MTQTFIFCVVIYPVFFLRLYNSSYSPFFQKSGRLIISGVREQWINRLVEKKENIGSNSHSYLISFFQAIWAMCWVWGVRPAASRTSVMLWGSHNTRKSGKKYQKYSMSPKISGHEKKTKRCWPLIGREPRVVIGQSVLMALLCFVLSDMKCSFQTWTRVAGGVYFKGIWHK